MVFENWYSNCFMPFRVELGGAVGTIKDKIFASFSNREDSSSNSGSFNNSI